MNIKTTLALVLLLAVAGVFYYLTRDVPGNPPPGQQQRRAAATTGQPLFKADELSTEAVSKVTIQRGGDKVVLERSGQDWKQVEPVSFPLSQWSAKQVVDKAATITFTDRFTPGKGGYPTLAEAGLESPEAVVTLETQATGDRPAATRVIKLGKRLGGAAYAQRGDEAEVYTINADAHQKLVRDEVKAWRDKALRSISEGAARRVELSHDGQQVTLTKPDGRWMLDEQRGDRADLDAVKALLGAVTSAYIRDFVADAPADLKLYGLDTPSLRLHVTSADDDRTLLVGAPADLSREAYFAMTFTGEAPASPVVFTLPATAIDKLKPAVDKLRDPRVTPVKAADVSELKVERGGAVTLHVSKGPEGWSFVTDPGFAADGEAVMEVLGQVTNARASAYATDVDAAAAPEATITLGRIGGAAPDRLLVLPRDGGDQKLVLRDGEKTGYVVPAAQLDRAFAPVVTLRERTILDVKPEELTAITVERGGVTFDLSRGEGGWVPASGEVEKEAAEALAREAATLRVESWKPAEEVAGDGVVRLTIRTTDTELALAVDPATRVAAGPWEQGVVVVPQPLVDAARAELRQRTVLPLQLTDVAAVVLQRGEQRFEAQRDADGRYTSPSGEAVDEAAAGAMFDELAGLRASRFVDDPLELKEPTTTLTLTLADGGTRVVRLWQPSDNARNEHLGKVGDGMLFTLTPESVERLLGPITPKAAAPPPAQQFTLPMGQDFPG